MGSPQVHIYLIIFQSSDPAESVAAEGCEAVPCCKRGELQGQTSSTRLIDLLFLILIIITTICLLLLFLLFLLSQFIEKY